MLYNLAYPVLLTGAKTNQMLCRTKARLGLGSPEMKRVVYTPDSYYRVTCWRLRRIDIFFAMLVSPHRAARLSVERFETIRQATIRPSALDADLPYQERAHSYKRDTVYVRYYGDQSKPRVLVLHGWNGNAGMLGEQVKALMDQGFAVVVPDLPGHGKSTGRRFSFYDLGIAIAEVLKDEHFAAVMGHSAGGLISILALHYGLKADRFIPIGSPSSLEEVLKSYVDVTQMPKRSYRYIQRYYARRYGMPPEDVGARTLEKLPVKSLIVHESRDWQVVVANAHALAEAAQQGELFLTKGRTHLNILKADEVHQRVGTFLTQEVAPC